MYYVNFNIYRTSKYVSNTLQNFTFMETTVFDIAKGPPKRLGTGRVKYMISMSAEGIGHAIWLVLVLDINYDPIFKTGVIKCL